MHILLGLLANRWKSMLWIPFPTCHRFHNSVSGEGMGTPPVTAITWVQSIRRHKTKTFFDVNDGSSPDNLQIVCPTPKVPQGLSVGSAVCVNGGVLIRNNSDQSEVHADSVRLLSPASAASTSEANPIVGAMSHSRPGLGLLRSESGLYWRHRLPEMAALLRLRAACKSAVHKALQARGYLEVDTPILTTADCEGAGETFLVTTTASEKARHMEDGVSSPPLHLTVSAQLHLEALALGMSKVYTLSPTFRAEPSHSRFHLAEFLMLEAESVTMTNVNALCDEIEAILRDITSPYFALLSASSNKDLGLVLSYLSESANTASPSEHLKTIEFVLSRPFARITFHEALDYLERHGKRTPTTLTQASGFNKEEEQELCDAVAGGGGVFVTDFPATQKPFYCALSSTSENSGQTAAAVDLLMPSVGEMVGGSVRETRREVLLTRMPGEEAGTLEWYANLRGHGGAPHGGFGLGFDRLLLWLLGIHNIRDTVPFPREVGKMYL